MKHNQTVKEFEKLGFEIEDTGGGCQWMRKQLNENVSLVITDGEAGLPDLTAQLYVMFGEHSDCLAKGELTTSVLLTDMLWKSGFGLYKGDRALNPKAPSQWRKGATKLKLAGELTCSHSPAEKVRAFITLREAFNSPRATSERAIKRALNPNQT